MRPPPIEVAQSGYPVVGGPASGQYHALPYGRRDLVVVVPPPLTYVAEAEVGPWASLDFEPLRAEVSRLHGEVARLHQALDHAVQWAL